MSDFPAVIQRSDLNGHNGFVLTGAAYDFAGRFVSLAGDVNGDGFDDLLIGAWYASPHGDHSGASYVVFGKADGFKKVTHLPNLDGQDGFVINGISAGDTAGTGAGGGDINGDGVSDMIIGASSAHLLNGAIEGASACYVVFGDPARHDPNFELSSLDGHNGFTLIGPTASGAGYSAGSAGDVNGDGFEDIIVGALHADPGGRVDAGASYVVFGKAGGFARKIKLAHLDGHDGFRLSGDASGDVSGRSVASAGDVNGDGLADVIVGAPGHNGQAGMSYVVFGSASAFPANIDLSTLDGHNGFALSGSGNDLSGISVASAGDLNADGIDDIAIGAEAAHGNTGAVYVVYGQAHGFGPSLNLTTLDGITGFRLDGTIANDGVGSSVSSAGDVNGDGFGDLLVGAYGFHDDGLVFAGATYVIFGGPAGGAASMSLGSLDGNNGFRIDGVGVGDRLGHSVSGGGDINGDGFDDIVAGSAYANVVDNDNNGESYVVFGAKPLEDVVRTGTAIGNTIHGGDFDDTLSGLSGGDTLIAFAGDDIVYGGSGADTVFGGDGADTVFGGSGHDTLSGDGNGDVLNGGSGDDTLYGGTGGDQLVGGDGADTIDGGADQDLFVFQLASESTGTTHDTVVGADFALDLFSVPGVVAAVDATIDHGRLAKNSFDDDLAHAVGAGHLGKHHAVLFTPDAGNLSGTTFLIVDTDNVAGYQAGADIVIQLVSSVHLGALDAGDFI